MPITQAALDAAAALKKAQLAERLATGRKLCSRCQQWLPLDSFGLAKSSPDQRRYYCKPCMNGYVREREAAKRSAAKAAATAETRARERADAARRAVDEGNAVRRRARIDRQETLQRAAKLLEAEFTERQKARQRRPAPADLPARPDIEPATLLVAIGSRCGVDEEDAGLIAKLIPLGLNSARYPRDSVERFAALEKWQVTELAVRAGIR